MVKLMNLVIIVDRVISVNRYIGLKDVTFLKLHKYKTSNLFIDCTYCVLWYFVFFFSENLILFQRVAKHLQQHPLFSEKLLLFLSIPATNFWLNWLYGQKIYLGMLFPTFDYFVSVLLVFFQTKIKKECFDELFFR